MCSIGVFSDAELQAASVAGTEGKRRGFKLAPAASDSIVGGRAVAQALLALAGSGITAISSSEREALRQAAVPLRAGGGGGGRRSEPAERLYAWNTIAPVLGRLLRSDAGLSADDKALLVAGDEVTPGAQPEVRPKPAHTHAQASPWRRRRW